MKLTAVTEGTVQVELDTEDCRLLSELCETADNSLGLIEQKPLSTIALAMSTAFAAMATASAARTN